MPFRFEIEIELESSPVLRMMRGMILSLVMFASLNWTAGANAHVAMILLPLSIALWMDGWTDVGSEAKMQSSGLLLVIYWMGWHCDMIDL